MTTLTLLTKISDSTQLKQVDKALQTLLIGLEVEVTILGSVASRWVQISLTGEDEAIAMNYLIQEVGLCPIRLDNVKNGSTLKGYIEKIGNYELSVDVGVFQPQIIHANVSLRHLQDELMDGRKIALRKIAKLFGLYDGIPINVRVNGFNEEKNSITAELSSSQINKFATWTESLLDRLIVAGASLHEIEGIIEYMKLDRDIIEVESLGILDQVLICKLGTNAAGLIPKIGRKLRIATFVVFNPKNLNNFLKT